MFTEFQVHAIVFRTSNTIFLCFQIIPPELVYLFIPYLYLVKILYPSGVVQVSALCYCVFVVIVIVDVVVIVGVVLL